MQNINTYKDLKDATMLFLNRNDQATRDMLPVFVNFAEKQFTRLVKLPYYETMSTFTIDQNFNYVVIPQDFLSAKHVTVNGFPYNRVDVETFQRLKNQHTAYANQPIVADAMVTNNNYIAASTKQRVFARIGEQVHFFPTPKIGDVVEMIYSQDIPEMNFDDDQPYSLLIAPDILLYLVLRHASIWLRDQDQEQYWNQKAQDAAGALMTQMDDAEWSGSALIVPQFND